MKLRYISLFSGIEACTVAWEVLGWEPAAFAQYEPGDRIQFSACLLKHRYPDVPNLGDVTQITEEQIAALGHVDLLVGGSPCQDLSLAGHRAGLRREDGSVTRSGLFDYQLQIFEWARRRCGCRWLLWENVIGALSSGKEVKGADFAYILGSMVQRDVPVPPGGWCSSGIVTADDWSRVAEWRVLDSQFFRESPQRRRTFVLCDSGPWWSRPPVLLEAGDGGRDAQAGGGKGKASSGPVQEGACQDVRDFELKAEPCKDTDDSRFFLYENHPQDSRVNIIRDDISPTLTCQFSELPLVRETVDGEEVLRYLTPEECERLDGFPTGYTDIPVDCSERRKKELRYIALGNSMAVPVMRWIGMRIEHALSHPILEDTSVGPAWQPDLFDEEETRDECRIKGYGPCAAQGQDD